MKKLACSLLYILGFVGFAHAQSVSITLDAGLLENANGTAVIPNNTGLLQLIASPSGAFATPTPNSFVGTGSDNFVFETFAMNSNGGVAGEVSNTFVVPLVALPAGDALLLRFYPGLTTTSINAPAGSAYGQVRSNSNEFPSDPSGTGWVSPASGAVDIYYNTANDSGTYPNGANGVSDGVPITSFASLTVVPEPSTYVTGLLGCATVAVAGARSLARRRSTPIG